jgi:uncharacterized protein YecT (DUF1311 family)
MSLQAIRESKSHHLASTSSNRFSNFSGVEMETQRQLETAAHMRAEQVNEQMKALIDRIQKLFTASPQVQAALTASQSAFEVYRAKQLDLVSASNDGTIGPLIRDTVFGQLTEQREVVLRNFLIDTKPDAA